MTTEKKDGAAEVVEAVAVAAKKGNWSKLGVPATVVIALIGTISTGAMKIQQAYDYISTLEAKVARLEQAPDPDPKLRELTTKLERLDGQVQELRQLTADYTQIRVRFELLQSAHQLTRSTLSTMTTAVNQILVLMAQHGVEGVTRIHPPVFMTGGSGDNYPLPPPSRGDP